MSYKSSSFSTNSRASKRRFQDPTTFGNQPPPPEVQNGHRSSKRSRLSEASTSTPAPSSSSPASSSSKRKASANGQQNCSKNKRKRKQDSTCEESDSSDSHHNQNEQLVDLTKKRRRRASAYHDDPNQTIKTSFSMPTRMPKGENNFLKKIISIYFRYCFMQECYNLMIIKNLATLLANYIFYKTAVDPLRPADTTPPKIQQDFFYRCLCSFNSNSEGIEIPNSPMKIPQAFEQSFGHLFRDFSAQSCPRQLNLRLVFKESLSIVARQLITNANEMLKRRTKVILKKLVRFLHPDVTWGMANFIANSLMEREFGIGNKKWTPQKFKTNVSASVYKATRNEFKGYISKETEAERWLFFHQELLKRDSNYVDWCNTNFRWLPLCKASKRPHVHLNRTLLKQVLPGKLGDLLRKLKKFEDPFSVFNYPRPLSYESPLKKYLHVRESHTSSACKKKRKRTHFRNRKILQRLTRQIQKFKKLFPRDNKKLSRDSKTYLRSHFEIATNTKDADIDWESLQNTLRWEYVLPNLRQVLKPNVLRCFEKFEHISTNGVEMSYYIYKESKGSIEARLSATDLTKDDLEGKILIGVDPGVRSLATSTYSSHLESKTLDDVEIFASKRHEKPWSTRMTSKEIRHKTDIGCQPLRNLRLNGQKVVKRRLMEIPCAKSYYSNYPHHLQKQPPQTIEEFNRRHKKYYLRSSRVFFSNPCKRWKWFSHRYLQASQSAMAKRILSPALCENKQEFQRVVSVVRKEMQAGNRKKSTNGSDVRKLIRKPWLEDLMVFQNLNNHSRTNVWSKIVVAFGNQCRNPHVVRGNYKTSCEKLCNSLTQLLKHFDGEVVDANEHGTSQCCHQCLNQVNANHSVNSDIDQNPIGVLKEDGIRYKRRFEGVSKHILQNGIDKCDSSQLYDGRKRSKHELRSCDNCSTLFNRDVNASMNIMNLFICHVNERELFPEN